MATRILSLSILESVRRVLAPARPFGLTVFLIVGAASVSASLSASANENSTEFQEFVQEARKRIEIYSSVFDQQARHLNADLNETGDCQITKRASTLRDCLNHELRILQQKRLYHESVLNEQALSKIDREIEALQSHLDLPLLYNLKAHDLRELSRNIQEVTKMPDFWLEDWKTTPWKRRILVVFKETFKSFKDPEILAVFAISTPLYFWSRQYDQGFIDRHTNEADRPLPKTLSKIGDYMGRAWWSFLPTYWIAHKTKSVKLRDFSDMLFVGLVYDTFVVRTFKALGTEARPNSTNREGFPSGHTSNLFVIATAVANTWGWKWGIPAYALASFGGFTRINDNAHKLSQVVAGAALGVAAGWTAAMGINKAKKKFGGGVRTPFFGSIKVGQTPVQYHVRPVFIGERAVRVVFTWE